MTTATLPTLRVGANRYPVVLPSLRDPRLHLAAVIISIHILGQTALGFRVSVPQILVAIGTCALIEVVWAFRRTGQIVWPASAMLTGSGVALIFRLVGVDRGDHWTWQGWHLFAIVAGLSLLTKYLIRRRGSHLFNPSNVGLVVAFLVLGSTRVEPLDFWWAPLDGWMVTAYLIIVAGGLLITARLRLLAMATTFWVVMALGLGLLAASGHCFTAAWALAPVCGTQFWQVVITSPELLVFLFFMITDPKTIPAGNQARILFAGSLALVCVLLMGPQTTEFGAKVALLGGLVVMSPLRSLFDRLAPPGGAHLGPLPSFARGAILGSSLSLAAFGIVIAGSPARLQASSPVVPLMMETAIEIDGSTLPNVTVAPEVLALNTNIDANELAMALAENLAIEGEAMRRADTSLLRAANDGTRLVEMERKVEEAATIGEVMVAEYSFDALELQVIFVDGPQGGASLGLEARGLRDEVTLDVEGVEQRREQIPFASVFVMGEGGGGRWLIADELPAPQASGFGPNR